MFGLQVPLHVLSLMSLGSSAGSKVMPNKKTSEIRLLPARRVPLAAEQYRQAVDLLAELLLDAAAKRRAVRSASGIGGASGGATGSVIPFPGERGNAHEAA